MRPTFDGRNGLDGRQDEKWLLFFALMVLSELKFTQPKHVMDLLQLYINWLRKVARAIEKRISPRPPEMELEAPILGKYSDEALNTPLTEKRIPVQKAFTKPAAYYAEMLRTAVSLYDSSASKGDASLIYACQVHAEWGLIYSGAAAIPFAIEMLKSPVPEGREVAAGVLGALGKNEGVVETLLEALANERETVTGDSLVLAVGQLRNRKAIPALASIIRDANADGDTRHLAADSLGQIVKRRFDKQADPIAAATEWLDRHKDGNATG
jgi:hypothetical protein